MPMTRRKERDYREQIIEQGSIQMTAQTKLRLEADLIKMIQELKEKTSALGATQDSAQDWHDNGAYDTLLSQLDVLKTQQRKLSAALENAEIIKPRQEIDTVQVGNSVLVRFQGEKQPEKYTLLGPKDNGTNRNWVSLESALGQALVGQQTGSKITLSNGRVIEVVEILPGDFE